MLCSASICTVYSFFVHTNLYNVYIICPILLPIYIQNESHFAIFSSIGIRFKNPIYCTTISYRFPPHVTLILEMAHRTQFKLLEYLFKYDFICGRICLLNRLFTHHMDILCHLFACRIDHFLRIPIAFITRSHFDGENVSLLSRFQ